MDPRKAVFCLSFYDKKPTYNALRLSLGAMKSHAENHKFLCIIMPQMGCGLDWFEWSKIQALVQEFFIC